MSAIAPAASAGFRQGPRVGLVGEGAIAEELQFAQEMGGGGRGPRGLKVRFGSREGHVGSPFVMDRAFRGLHRRDKRRASRVGTLSPKRRAAA